MILFHSGLKALAFSREHSSYFLEISSIFHSNQTIPSKRYRYMQFEYYYKKKNPFTVPEGYFDELTGRITGRIEKQKEVKKSSSLRGLKPYMGLVAIFFLALMVVQILFPGAKNTDLPDIEGENAIVQEMEAEDIFDSQFNPTNEEIIEYLASEVDNYEMILAGIY